MARPSKLNAEVTRLIAAGLRTGATLYDASAVAGVSTDSVYHWCKIGNEVLAYQGRVDRGVKIEVGARRELTARDLECAAFAAAVREARAAFAVEHLNAIVSAALEPSEKRTTICRQQLNAAGAVVELVEHRVERVPPDPRASMWLLERRLPKVFGNRAALELSGPDGGEIPIPTDVLREDLLAKIQAMVGPRTGEPIDAEVVEPRVLSLVADLEAGGEPPETTHEPSSDADAASGAEGS